MRSTTTSALLPTRRAMLFGRPIIIHIRRLIGIGQRIGTPALVIMSPRMCTKQPTPTANPISG